MYIESIEEARIYNFYGDVEPIEEGVIDALKSFVDKLRKAILALIDKIDKLLDNAKNSKLKSALKSLLSRAKSLLSRTNNITSKEDALAIKKEAEKIKGEIQGTVSSFAKECVEENDVKAVRTAIVTMSCFLDKSTFENTKATLNYAKSRMPDLFQEDNGESYDTEHTVQNYRQIAMLLMNNFSEKKWNDIIAIGNAIF